MEKINSDIFKKDFNDPNNWINHISYKCSNCGRPYSGAMLQTQGEILCLGCINKQLYKIIKPIDDIDNIENFIKTIFPRLESSNSFIDKILAVFYLDNFINTYYYSYYLPFDIYTLLELLLPLVLLNLDSHPFVSLLIKKIFYTCNILIRSNSEYKKAVTKVALKLIEQNMNNANNKKISHLKILLFEINAKIPKALKIMYEFSISDKNNYMDILKALYNYEVDIHKIKKLIEMFKEIRDLSKIVINIIKDFNKSEELEYKIKDFEITEQFLGALTTIKKSYISEELVSIITNLLFKNFAKEKNNLKLKKASLSILLAFAFSTKENFKALYHAMSEEAKQFLNIMLFKKPIYRFAKAKKDFNFNIELPTNRWEVISKKSFYVTQPDLFLLESIDIEGFSYYTFKYFTINQEFKAILFKYLSDDKESKDYFEITDNPLCDFIFEQGTDVIPITLTMLNIVFTQAIQLNKNKTKILAKSLKEISTNMKLDEFYLAPKENKLKYLRTSFVINFFREFDSHKAQTPNEVLKECFNLYFESDDINKFFFNDFTSHLKYTQSHLDYSYSGLFDYTKITLKKSLSQIKNLLSILPQNKWVTVDSIFRYIKREKIFIRIFDNLYLSNYVYFITKEDNSDKDSYPNKIKFFIKEYLYFDAFVIPFIKGFFFFLASFGIVDIGYNEPSNENLQLFNKPYLSIYDGLSYVKLTDFGAYIIDKSDSFEFKDSNENKFSLKLDDKRLIITTKGSSINKEYILKQISKSFKDNTYIISYNSFLNKCSTTNEIYNRIKLFKSEISNELPQNWQDFFNDIKLRINPYTPIPYSIKVFKLKNDERIKSLVVNDPILKKIVLKAEGFYILVKNENVDTLKNRFMELGYFIELPS